VRISRFARDKGFIKQLAKLSGKQREKVREALKEALNHPQPAKLRLHALRGEFAGQYSLSAGGDLRIHFRPNREPIPSDEWAAMSDEQRGTFDSDSKGQPFRIVAELISVGTHAQLYE
jgi:mRNA-degrading endonuclease YafQ of YafQ-DinJ toxin-antitoxin module